MNISIEPQADGWFKENVGIPEGYGIRFKPMIYGSSPVQKGFTLAFEPNQPRTKLGAELLSGNKVWFYIEEDDLWFFDNHDLKIDYDAELDEPKYIYLKDNQPINN